MIGEVKVYAFEFRAKVKDGAIEIPPEYRDKLKEMVRVIILAEEEIKTVNLIDRLLQSPLHHKGFQPLSRDEIYACA
jgi:hypothetical protein